ncbi:thiamine biosynthesis protein ThiF [Xylanimonas oleitrophica]|uniref:Thiamine biosynthesis protein ThiF n=1 Tax=Xylanimonas oleitrophica TaxID=2607479 RepID=A0A2W5WUP2_9MICO|nr:ThiF family adenylyltransferase [Xylanimonas oleitrophica]PZR54997.1 thiamine biosynthesis protein ThiF [Xylanimonas oleitrophica]
MPPVAPPPAAPPPLTTTAAQAPAAPAVPPTGRRAHPAPPLDDVRLRPGTPVLDRGHGEVQLGTDPRWAVRVGGLDDAEVAWLRELAVRRHTSPTAAARRRGIDPGRRDEIALLLHHGGFLQHTGTTDRQPPAVATVTATADGAADSPTLGALRADGAGRATLATRARRCVGVAGLGRTGAAVALHLATAGVGTLVLQDASPVQTTDLGLGAYRPGDVGRPRHETLAATLAQVAPRCRVRTDGAPDVVVLVETHSPAPARYARLVGEGVPHLPVTVREADVVVGPFVLPGTTACARCADLHRTDDDPVWPALAAQLRGGTEPPQETTLAAAGASLACAQVLAHLDGLRPTSAGALLEVALPETLPEVRRVPPHPRCGCTTLRPAARALGPAGPRRQDEHQAGA